MSMFDLEGISTTSEEGIRHEGVTSTQMDYINEIIPSQSEWNNMSLSERQDTVLLINSRIDEVEVFSGISSDDISSTLPDCAIAYMEEGYTIAYLEDVSCLEDCIEDMAQFYLQGKDIEYQYGSLEQREALAVEFFEGVQKDLGISCNLEFSSMKPYECGCYSSENGSITLNSQMLESNDPSELLKTIVHESRHAYQQECILAPNESNISSDTIAAWAMNYMPGYYIPFEWDPEAYQEQPLEKDAFTFENYVYEQAMNRLS